VAVQFFPTLPASKLAKLHCYRKRVGKFVKICYFRLANQAKMISGYPGVHTRIIITTEETIMAKIGFIGLGTMGCPMAERLIKAGHELRITRVKDASRYLVDLGATACETPAEVTQGSEIVILIVPDTPDVDSVLFGDRGVASTLGSGAILVDMSSISPLATKEFASKINALGAQYVDAPVSGGETGAREGTLSIMVGGTRDAVASVRPVLEAMGKNITHVGDIGAGQTVKVANQIVVGLTIQAVSEAFLLAKKAGVDLQVARDAMLGGFAQSRILELHGQRMIDETFDPGFKIALHRKDLNIALTNAGQLNVALPNTAGVVQIMNAAIAQGEGQSDHSALFRVLGAISGSDSE
tara:strand:- start:70376 stop:71437 length:1062 start_codon:yes stop_codon:yes gene_type:complete